MDLSKEREIEMTIGGESVPLNEFVQTVSRNVILGLTASLKDVDPKGEIVIRIKPAR